MAEIRVFAQQAKRGGGKLHLGATSMDVEDTVETYRLRLALSHIGANLDELLGAFGAQIRRYADLVCMAYTHLQPAEPTTLGYRLAAYAQDLLVDDEKLRFVFENLTTKGLRGAVGTAASYERLTDGRGASAEIEAYVLERFGLRAREISTQTYPRKLDYLLLAALAGLGASLSKFAADVRMLAAPASARSPSRSRVSRSAAPRCRSSRIRFCASASARSRACFPRMRTSRGKTPRPTSWSARSTTAQTGAPFFPKRFLCADEIVTARSNGRRGAASRRTAHRGEPSHVRAVRRDASSDAGGGSSRRGPPASARNTARCIDGSVGGGGTRRG